MYSIIINLCTTDVIENEAIPSNQSGYNSVALWDKVS